MSLEVESLVKVYGEQRALDNISFSAKKERSLASLGPNGAGKSTTMKIATCFIPPTSGTIKVCGFDVTLNPIEAMQKIGYLPENNPLYTDMYVKEYLEFTGASYGLKGKLLEDRINEMIEITGLIPEKKKKVGMLSKGYRQRVGLAAAMIHNPEVLILDEPTTGLDPNQVLEIRNLIRQAGREKTVIFSSHIMQEVQEICDRVVIINSGKIVADNDVNKLTTSTLKGYKIIVQFSEEIKPNLLSAVKGVDKVNKLEANRYEISSETKDIRQDVFKVINEQGWNLLEMKTEEMTFGKVFRQLTK